MRGGRGTTEHRGTLAAAAIAVLMTTALGALQSVAWHGADAPGVARALTASLDPGLLVEAASSSLDRPSESYFGYGRLVVAIYALLFIAGFGMRCLLPRPVRWAATALLAFAAGGDIVAYWASESAGPSLRRIGFWYTEVPALAAAIALLTGVGARSLRQGGAARVLAICLPVALATTALLGYLLHGMLLGLALTALLTCIAYRPSDAHPAPGAERYSRVRAAAIALSIFAGGVLLAAIYRPTLQPGPRLDTGPLSVSEKLDGARLHVFNTGYNRMSWLLVGRERPWRPVPAFVIEHPESGLFVFDTGFPDDVAERGEAGLPIPERWVIESRGALDLTLPAQMRRAGLDPEAVHHVAISHLHGDHVGQLEAFPNARIIGGPGSATFAVNRVFAERWHEQAFDSASRFGPFDEAAGIFGDGSIVLVRGGGHAREGLMLLLALDEGPVLLAGDAVVHSDWLRSNDVQRIPVNAERAAFVRNQVRLFLDEIAGSAVAYGHDLRGIDCARRDIVCHREELFHPEAHPEPET